MSRDKEGEIGKEGARKKEYGTKSRWGGGSKNSKEGGRCLEKEKAKDK